MPRRLSEVKSMRTLKVTDHACVAGWALRIANQESRLTCYEARITRHESRLSWRASPHCMVVNLVRSGRKQPQLFFASAGGRARLPLSRERYAARALAASA